MLCVMLSWWPSCKKMDITYIKKVISGFYTKVMLTRMLVSLVAVLVKQGVYTVNV